MTDIEALLNDLREERADNARLIAALDKSERFAAECAKQCGDLAEGVASALEMNYSGVVPSDAAIIAETALCVSSLKISAALLADCLRQMDTDYVAPSIYGRINSMAAEKLAARIRSFLEESDERGNQK